MPSFSVNDMKRIRLKKLILCITSLFILIYTTIIVTSYGTLLYKDHGYTSPDKSHMQRQQDKPEVNTPQSIKKVMFFAYMRGGSSFVSDTLKLNDKTFYVYEPLDGIYQSLHQYSKHVQQLDILFNTNLTYRTMKNIEKNAIMEFMGHFFKCNLKPLPVEWKTSAFTFYRGSEKGMDSYRDCFGNIDTSGISEAYDEEHTLSLHRIVWSLYNKTRDQKHPAKYCHNIYTKRHMYNEHLQKKIPDKLLCQPLNYSIKCPEDVPISNISKRLYHQLCMQNLDMISNMCISNLEESCSQSEIRAFKTIRMDSGLLEHIFQNIPDLKMVYFIRNPIAIMISRSSITNNFMSKISQRLGGDNYNAIQRSELKLLCKIMRKDYHKIQYLDRKYPGRILQMKYEDLVIHGKENVEKIYRHIGEQTPTNLVQKMFNGTEDNGKFGTQRKNSTETAFRTLNSLPLSEKLEFTKICSETLRILGY